MHYVTPTEDNRDQTARMKAQGIFAAVNDEVGEIIVADVNAPRDRGAARRRIGARSAG